MDGSQSDAVQSERFLLKKKQKERRRDVARQSARAACRTTRRKGGKPGKLGERSGGAAGAAVASTTGSQPRAPRVPQGPVGRLRFGDGSGGTPAATVLEYGRQGLHSGGSGRRFIASKRWPKAREHRANRAACVAVASPLRIPPSFSARARLRACCVLWSQMGGIGSPEGMM